MQSRTWTKPAAKFSRTLGHSSAESKCFMSAGIFSGTDTVETGGDKYYGVVW